MATDKGVMFLILVVVCFKIGSYYIAQAGLALYSPGCIAGDPPASASSTGIIDYTQLALCLKFKLAL
jgi:hypothetical protein